MLFKKEREEREKMVFKTHLIDIKLRFFIVNPSRVKVWTYS